MKYYILVANASEANLYSTDNLRVGKLNALSSFTHPESKKKGADLITDRPGRNIDESQKGSSGNLGQSSKSAFEKSDPKKDEAEKFAIELANHLLENYNKNLFDELVVYSDPSLFGFLEKHLDKNIKIKKFTSKDYTSYNLEQMEKIMHDMFFPEK